MASRLYYPKIDDEEDRDTSSKSVSPQQSSLRYVQTLVRLRQIDDYKLWKALQGLLEYIERLQASNSSLTKEIERMKIQMEYMSLGVQRKEVSLTHHHQRHCIDVQKQNLDLKSMLTKSNLEILSQRRTLPTVEAPVKRSFGEEVSSKLGASPKPKLQRQQRVLNIDEIYRNSLNSQQEHQDFLQNQTDFAFFKILLDIDAEDADIFKLFTENLHFQRVKTLLAKKEEKLYAYFMQLGEKEFASILESMRYLQSMAELLLESSLKLKRLVKAVWTIQQSLLLQETFQRMVEETCRIFSCDRASVFLYDNKKGELWSRGAIGTHTIKIPVGRGIAGHVASTGEYLNILDAHKDKRFNSEHDKKTNYRTKSILCMPIMDLEQKSVVGVIQAINKNNKSKDFFTKDDEGLMSILVRMASTIFRNSLFYDSKLVVQNQLRQLVYAAIQLSGSRTLKHLIRTAEDSLFKLFDIQLSKLYLYNPREKILFRYDNEEIVKVAPNVGIIGEVFQSEKPVSAANPFNHPQFNLLSDLDTKLPILCLPIKDQDNRTVGVLQSVDAKGIENLLYQQEKLYQINSPFFETLKNFCQIFVQVMWLVEAAEDHLIQP